MVDDYNYDYDNNNNNGNDDPAKDISFLKLDGQLNDDDDDPDSNQEYWRYTRDCDYRQILSSNVIQEADVRVESDSPGSIGENQIENEIDKLIECSKNNVIIDKSSSSTKYFQSRKKRKKFNRKINGIDLTNTKQTSATNNVVTDSVVVDVDDTLTVDGIDLADIDKLDFDELIKYYNKLKEEFTILNLAEQQQEDLDQNDAEITESTTEIPIVDFDQISSSDDGGDDDDIGSDSITEPPMDFNSNNIRIEDCVQQQQPSPPLFDYNEVTPTSLSNEDKPQQQIEIENSNSNSNSNTDWLLNEQMLREKLIRSMMEKTKTKMIEENPVQESNTLQQQQRGSPLSVIDCNGIDSIVSKNQTELLKPKMDLSRYQLIIHVSSDDDDESESELPSTSTKSPLTTNKNISLIKKLNKNQQKEYEKLRKEIERREASSSSTSISLSSTANGIANNEKQNRKNIDRLGKSLISHESLYRKTMANMERKKQSMYGLNRKFTALKTKLTKSKDRLLKLKRSYLLAQKNYKLLAVQFQLATKEMNILKRSLNIDTIGLRKQRLACMRIGQKLYGQKYQLTPAKQPLPKQTEQLPTNRQTKAKKKLRKKQTENRLQSLIYFRKRIQSSIRNFANANTVFILFQHCVHFNFNLIRSSRFLQSKCFKIPFSDFTENSSQQLDSKQLDRYCTGLDFQHYQSVLCHFNSYRFAETIDLDSMMMDFWSNGLSPMARICHFDLMGSCNDQTCSLQHQKDYLYGQREKLLDILSYSEEFAAEIPPLDEVKKNPRLLAEKLDEFLGRKQLTMVVNEKSSTLEEIAQQFAQSIRSNDQSKITVSSLLIRLFPKELIHISMMAANRLETFKTKIPFDDYHYRFDYRLSFNNLFNLKLNRLVNDYRKIDPDSFIHYRYFAPEGIPITAQLESSLSNDPNNIQMWINLAYYHLSKITSTKNEDRLYCLDSALNVLTRALELNRKCEELYEHYLLIWINRSSLLSENDSNEQNKKICQQILKNCSTFPLWIRYLNLCTKISEKLSVSLEILQKFLQPNGIEYCEDSCKRSLLIIEMIFYRINLMLHLNHHQEAVKFFNEIFNPTLSSSSVSDLGPLNQLIIAKHRSFAWHCYIHLVLYSCLPYHCFDLSNKSGQFLSLLNTEPIIFQWNNVNDNDDDGNGGINRSELRMIKKIFKRALRNCCLDNDGCSNDNNNDYISKCSCPNPMDSCFALRLNLTNLNRMLIKTINDDDSSEDYGDQEDDEDDLDNYLAFIFADQNRNIHLLNDLQILHLFEIDLKTNDIIDGNNDNKMLTASGMVNLIENFQQSSSIKSNEELSSIENQLKFNYWLAFYHKRLGNIDKCREILRRNLSYYYKDDFHNVVDDDYQFIRLYEKLLFNSDGHNPAMIAGQQQSMDFGFIDFRFPKSSLQQHYSIYLYLSYMLYNHLTISDDDNDNDKHLLRLDSIYTTVINSIWNDNDKDGHFAKIFSFNYFLMLLDCHSNCDTYFKIIYENLRHICLQFGDRDPIFIYHMVITISDFIQPMDRLYFLIEICRLNPTNMMLILKVCHDCLQQQKKETLWKLIAYIVYERKIRLQCLEFWKIAISLSVERSDHLNAHKLFQLAITLMPYNTILWDMLKNYEKSIDHQEHLLQIQSHYHDSLGMDDLDGGGGSGDNCDSTKKK
uniref:Uncharacterized protein LOC113793816 n=1 Tax=Dermatophagoides pteronyssinus TaxID=6956 RepID=A0A6P6Y2G9_DERPT|nr:uncharacterized protein LOC113793816 [Dermatophagoides pteronyssinus]